MNAFIAQDARVQAYAMCTQPPPSLQMARNTVGSDFWLQPTVDQSIARGWCVRACLGLLEPTQPSHIASITTYFTSVAINTAFMILRRGGFLAAGNGTFDLFTFEIPHVERAIQIRWLV